MRGRGDGVRGSAGRAGPGHGRLGVAHTEVTGFTCRGAGRSPSDVPCLPRQRIKGFESRSEQDDSYICGSICDAERESHEEPARAHHGARRGQRSRRRHDGRALKLLTGFPPAPEAITPSPWFLRMPVLHGPPQVLGLT